MALNQRNLSSRWRRTRAANTRPLHATTSQPSASRLGEWRQNYERYKRLAESAGRDDAVTREGYWQHAEHFIRLINDAIATQPAL